MSALCPHLLLSSVQICRPEEINITALKTPISKRVCVRVCASVCRHTAGNETSLMRHSVEAWCLLSAADNIIKY